PIMNWSPVIARRNACAPLMYFLSVHPNEGRRCDSDPSGVILNRQHGDPNIVTDHNLLADTSRQNQHPETPSLQTNSSQDPRRLSDRCAKRTRGQGYAEVGGVELSGSCSAPLGVPGMLLA